MLQIAIQVLETLSQVIFQLLSSGWLKQGSKLSIFLNKVKYIKPPITLHQNLIHHLLYQEPKINFLFSLN